MKKQVQAVLMAALMTTTYMAAGINAKADSSSDTTTTTTTNTYVSQIKSEGGKILYQLTDGDMYYKQDSDTYTTYYYFDTDLITYSAKALDAATTLTTYPYGAKTDVDIDALCKEIDEETEGITEDKIDNYISYATNSSGEYKPQKIEAYIPDSDGGKKQAFYIDNEEFTGVYLEIMRLYGLIKESAADLQNARTTLIDLIKTDSTITYSNELPQILIRSFFLGIKGALFEYNGTIYEITTDNSKLTMNGNWTTSNDGQTVSGTFVVTAGTPTSSGTVTIGTSGEISTAYTAYSEIDSDYLPVDSFGTFVQTRQLTSTFTDYSDYNFTQILSADDFKTVNEGRKIIGKKQKILEYNEGQYKAALLWMAKLRGQNVDYSSITTGDNLAHVDISDIIDVYFTKLSGGVVVQYNSSDSPVSVSITKDTNSDNTFYITVQLKINLIS